MLPTYIVLVSLEMAWGNQGTHTALSRHCPHVHCLLHYTACLFLYTVGQWVILSFQWDFLLFCLLCIPSELEQIRNVFKLLQIFEVLFWETGGIIQYKGQCLFSQESLVVWGAPGALCIFLNVLIFWQTHIGGINAFWLGTYLTESVFTKLKFWGFFCTINFFMTGCESHHFHITGLCSTRMVNRDNVSLKPCL